MNEETKIHDIFNLYLFKHTNEGFNQIGTEQADVRCIGLHDRVDQIQNWQSLTG